jgi:peptidoglycan/LPS O-acetylase OafA/YrhL
MVPGPIVLVIPGKTIEIVGMLNPVPADGRVPSLDGWRAVAIALVLVSHMSFASQFPDGRLGWLDWVFDGGLGVRIFFVLSGFLITLLLLREVEKTGTASLKRFYLRRVLRIFPVYFAYLIVLAALTAAGLYADSASSWIGCLTFTRNMLGRGRSATVHFWSLAVEEQFYVIWPILLCRLRLWRRSGLFVGTLLVPIAFCPIARGFFASDELGATLSGRLLGPRSILLFADSLAVGCLGAWMAWKIPRGGRWNGLHSLGLAACLAVIIGGRWAEVAAWGNAAAAIVPAVQAWAILGCLWLGSSARSPGYGFLNSKPWVTLGVLSYSIYVWHFLFLSHFMGPRFERSFLYDWRIWILPAVAVSALSYHFLELPMTGLRRRLHGARTQVL